MIPGARQLARIPYGQTDPFDQVKLLPPIANPDKILCAGLNYASHIAETERKAPVHPRLFARLANAGRMPTQRRKSRISLRRFATPRRMAKSRRNDLRAPEHSGAIESCLGLAAWRPQPEPVPHDAY
jgi:hypothetical protein